MVIPFTEDRTFHLMLQWLCIRHVVPLSEEKAGLEELNKISKVTLLSGILGFKLRASTTSLSHLRLGLSHLPHADNVLIEVYN